jgi:nitrate/nitrite transporter NarK
MLLLARGIYLVTAMLLLSVSTKYWQIMLTIGVLAGLGISLIFTPAIAAVDHFFWVKRGTATGVAAMGGLVGGILFPLALPRGRHPI